MLLSFPTLSSGDTHRYRGSTVADQYGATMRQSCGVSLLTSFVMVLGGAPGSLAADFGNAQVIELSQAGLSDELIILKIRSSPDPRFDLSTDALLALRKAGVSNTVLAAMMGLAEPVAEPAPTPAPAPEDSPPLPAPISEADAAGFPFGLQTKGFASRMRLAAPNNALQAVLSAPYRTVWSATVRAAELLDAVGGRRLEHTDERTGRIQCGKVTLDSLVGSRTGSFQDEFVFEVRKVSDTQTRVTITRRVLAPSRQIGASDKGLNAQVSNGRIEQWLFDKIGRASAADAGELGGAPRSGAWNWQPGALNQVALDAVSTVRGSSAAWTHYAPLRVGGTQSLSVREWSQGSSEPRSYDVRIDLVERLEVDGDPWFRSEVSRSTGSSAQAWTAWTREGLLTTAETPEKRRATRSVGFALPVRAGASWEQRSDVGTLTCTVSGLGTLELAGRNHSDVLELECHGERIVEAGKKEHRVPWDLVTYMAPELGTVASAAKIGAIHVEYWLNREP